MTCTLARARGRLARLVLEEAAVVESIEVPSDIITMNSLFKVEDPESGEIKKLRLCYPECADAAQGCISVFSPAGASFLGLRVGQTATWQSPHGPQHTAVVKQMLFQPESSGHYTL